MKQIQNFGDDRNKGWCVYCGGLNETRDHVPSRVLLDKPYPTDLPVVPACNKCNSSFSKDEEYLACLVECAIAGTILGAKNRTKIANIFKRSPSLESRIETARYEQDDNSGFIPEKKRMQNIILKLARGHAAFENNEPRLDDPLSISIVPFSQMDVKSRSHFERNMDSISVVPEVGSRAMTRMVTGHDHDENQWIIVQPGLYRYRIQWSHGFRVQLVIREFLAAEIIWE